MQIARDTKTDVKVVKIFAKKGNDTDTCLESQLEATRNYCRVESPEVLILINDPNNYSCNTS